MELELEYCNFVPCSVQHCGVKVKGREPVLDFAAFVAQEQVLTSLHEEETKEICGVSFSNPSVDHGVVLPTKSAISLRRGKPVYGLIGTAGYNASRSDFETEFDNQAELILGGREFPMETISTVHKNDQLLADTLQYSITNMYNIRLSERIWRKQIIRNHALIDSKKLYTLQQRLEAPFGKRNLLVLLKFMRFLTGPELDFIIEGIMHQNSLKHRLNSFLNFRTQGIRFKNAVKIFENLNKKHLKYSNDHSYQSITLSSEIVGAPRTGRKPSAPLILHNLPGYELLDEDERHLCSTVRIVPETYHNFKHLLISECKKNDGLKLATARQVIKIDVNKTRKMYDLLKQKGLVWEPKTSS